MAGEEFERLSFLLSFPTASPHISTYILADSQIPHPLPSGPPVASISRGEFRSACKHLKFARAKPCETEVVYSAVSAIGGIRPPQQVSTASRSRLTEMDVNFLGAITQRSIVADASASSFPWPAQVESPCICRFLGGINEMERTLEGPTENGTPTGTMSSVFLCLFSELSIPAYIKLRRAFKKGSTTGE